MLAADAREAAAPASAEVVAGAEVERPVLELLVDFAVRDANAVVSPPALEHGPAPEHGPALEYGTVLCTEGELTVSLNAGARAARRAKSCLVAPDRGDRVLCAREGDTVYVLAVLGGAPSSATRIVADGELELSADTLRLRAKSALVALGALRVLGRSLDAHFADKVELFAERVESRATTLVQRTKQAFRFIEALEQVRAGVFDLRAESLAAIRGENTIVAARVLAKLDGEQVKIG